MQEQLHFLLKNLVHKNNINLHQEELKLQLLSHPSYPSLHSLTGALTHYGIPNLALGLKVNQEILTQPPLLIISQKSSEFLKVEVLKSLQLIGCITVKVCLYCHYVKLTLAILIEEYLRKDLL